MGEDDEKTMVAELVWNLIPDIDDDEVTATGEADPIPEIGDGFPALKRAAQVVPGVRDEVLALISRGDLR